MLHSTSPAAAPTINRRGLLASLSALPVLAIGTGTPMRAAPSDDDADLIAACGRYLTLWRHSENHPAAFMARPPAHLEAERDDIIDELAGCIFAIERTAPRTFEGLRAKARVALTNSGMLHDPEPGSEDALWWSICTAILEIA